MSLGQGLGGVVGAVAGFFIGGPVGALYGAQIGITAGGIIDPPKGPTLVGPRLNDLSAQTSTYGATQPRNYGSSAQLGNVFWLQGDKLEEVATTTTSGGKGGGGGTKSTTYSYYATFAVGLCKGPIDGVRRIWIGNQLWYDAGSDDIATIIASNENAGSSSPWGAAIGLFTSLITTVATKNYNPAKFKLYTGTDTQEPDPAIQADRGVANVPGYRGLAYLVFYRLPLEKWSNSLVAAQVKVEIVKNGTISYVITNLGSIAAGNHTTTSGPWSLAVQASRAYVVNIYDNTLEAFDISDPSHMRSIKKVSTGNAPTVVRVMGNYAYVCIYNSLLQIFDLNADSLTLVGQVNTAVGGEQMDVARIGNFTYAFVGGIVGGSGSFLKIYDVTDPTSPMLLKTIALGSGISYPQGNEIRCTNGYLYVTSTYLLEVFDVSVPANAYLVGSLALTGNPMGMDVGANYAYILDYGGQIQIVDISNPASPSIISSVATSGSCRKLTVVGGYAYAVSATTDVVEVFDVSNPLSPFLAQTAPTLSTTPWDVFSFDGFIFYVTIGGYLEVAFFSGKKITGNSVQLSTIVQAECLLSNLITAADIDVTELTDQVRGYRIGSVGAIRAALDPLRAAWPFDVVPDGYKIKFKRRGSASVATITENELGARAAGESPAVRVTESREMDSVLPGKVVISYSDVTREYDVNQQQYERINTDAINERVVEMPISLVATEAANIAQSLMYLYWLERYDVSLKLPPSYSRLQPGDVITVTTSKANYELRLTSTNLLPDGRINVDGKLNQAAIYTPTAAGEEGQSTGGVLALAGPTVYQILDMPLLRDDDDTAGFSVAMTGVLTGWPGGILYRSDDSGQTWVDIAAAISPGAIMGYTTNSIGAAGSGVYDSASVLNVKLYQGALASVTDDQLFAGQNWFAYGAHGRWEIVAARTATLKIDGTFDLQDFLRGQRGTEWASGLHQAGDVLVLLSAADLQFVSVNSSTIGASRAYRGITSGKSMNSDSDLNLAYEGVNLECLSPVHLTGNRHPTTNDWTLSWVRRSRFDQWRDYVDEPLGEASESYEIDVFTDGTYTTVKRTLTASAPTVTYTSADQVTDFGSNQTTLYVKVYQLSATVGRGYPLTQSITR